MAKERAGRAFAGLPAFILINRITGVLSGISSDMLVDPTVTVESFIGAEMVVKDYFTSVLESPALNIGVFVGIISGFLGPPYLINSITLTSYHRRLHSLMENNLYPSLLF